MTIKFLITALAWKPLGGLKMIYEYANRLAADGHDVHIYYGLKSLIGNQNILAKLKSIGKYTYFRVGISDWHCTNWYKLSPAVTEHLIWALTPQSVGPADRYVATTLGSAYWLNNFPENDKATSSYFIQGFENWGNGIIDDTVYESYRFPFRKIVIANWLKERVSAVGNDSNLVVNGFDFNQFKLLKPIESRNPLSIVMMYNQGPAKGCADCFAAIEIAKMVFPELHVQVFGVPPRPDFLPEWYHYTQQPDKETLVNLYNQSAIYVAASHSEGWGLTIGEAMACGCAVVCTDNAGYLEMAEDGVNALVSPIKTPDLLAQNIMRLLSDNDLRINIAKAGNESIQKFGIELSYKEFKRIVTA